MARMKLIFISRVEKIFPTGMTVFTAQLSAESSSVAAKPPWAMPNPFSCTGRRSAEITTRPSSTSVMCNANFSALQSDDVEGIKHMFCSVYPGDCKRGVLTVEFDKDRPGRDYNSFDVGNSYRQCYDPCARDKRCRAYTFVPPGVQGPSARCYLKDAIPAAGKNVGMVSGFKP